MNTVIVSVAGGGTNHRHNEPLNFIFVHSSIKKNDDVPATSMCPIHPQ